MDEYGQYSRPDGELGRDTLRKMNEHHRDLVEWAVSVLPDITPGLILDIGCGGGMPISILAERFGSDIRGIDISGESVEMTSEYNAELVSSGRLSVSLDSVSNVPFADGTFDLVTAFETYFFWPDLANDIIEAGRVTAEGGHILVVSETYPHPDFDERNREMINTYGMNIVTNREMAEMLEDAGFVVETAEVVENNWVAFIGRKVTS